jgi:hypothetical protein
VVVIMVSPTCQLSNSYSVPVPSSGR